MKLQINKYITPLFVSGLILLFFTGCKKDEEENSGSPTPVTTVTDIDGNVYHTVTIGTQTWLVENLKTTKYRNGDAIQNVTDANDWTNLSTGAWCYYNNDNLNNTTYGKLYNYYAVADSRNICPVGYHVPSTAEWQVLVDFLGGASIGGGKLKETGTTHWQTPNADATDTYGFKSLPGGVRWGTIGSFAELGNVCFFSSSNQYDSEFSILYQLFYNTAQINNGNGTKRNGISVKCIKD